MKNIKITDITLKNLANDGETALLFREKTAIAACADAIGVDAVELAPIKNLREDTIIYKTVAKNLKGAALSVPVGFDTASVAAAWESVKDAARPRLQVELPVSTVQMEYSYHVKADKMLVKIAELVAAAKALCAVVEFSAADATRADVDFLVSAVKTAEENGADIITVCDDAGVSLPGDVAAMTAKVKAAVAVPVYVKVSDRISMGAASALAAISEGADGIKCAMAGKAVLSTGVMSDVISACGAAVGACTDLKNTKIHASIDDLLTAIGRSTYATEQAVSEKKKLLLDSHSTIAQVAQAAAVLGYDLSDADCGNVYKALIQVCEKKDAVGAAELEAIIASSAMQAPSTYHLESYTTNSSNLTGSMSQVTLKCNGDILSGVSMGDGAVDSAFRAIEQCMGHHYELDDFQVQAVTEGKEALGSAVVRLRNNGKLYSGNGTSTDIVAASIRAYINALNKIVFEEE